MFFQIKPRLGLGGFLLSALLATTAMADTYEVTAPPGEQELSAEESVKLCNQLIDNEAAMAYNQDAVKALMAETRQCPKGGTLRDTIIYVDNLLQKDFDDPYTVVSPPDVAEAFQQRMAGTEEAFAGGGIGLSLSFDLAKTMPVQAGDDPSNPRLAFTGLIYHAFAAGPAAKAGVKDGDVITKVDGQPVIGLDATRVVGDLMRGKVGSKIEITVMRGGKEKTFKMERSKVVSDNVWSRDLGNGIYSIVVTEFRSHTASEIFNAIQLLPNSTRGLILDLRGNPGGLLDDAILSAAWFVHDGVIVSRRERVPGDPNDPKYVRITYTRVGPKVVVDTVDESTGKLVDSYDLKLQLGKLDPKTGKASQMHATDQVPFLGYVPVVVLANGSSASAAEVFTGAVSENHIAGKAAMPNKPVAKDAMQGATFVGTKTFGKFIGQSVGSGPMGVQLKATSFRYFSPRGEWLGDAHKHRIGLTPDVKVDQPDKAIPYTESDAQLKAAVDLLSDGKKH